MSISSTTTRPMKNPSHPGAIVRGCMNELGLTVTAAADALGVSRQALNNLVNQKGGISPEMAVRLAKSFGSTTEFWLRLQMKYDLAHVPEDKIRVKSVFRAAGGRGAA